MKEREFKVSRRGFFKVTFSILVGATIGEGLNSIIIGRQAEQNNNLIDDKKDELKKLQYISGNNYRNPSIGPVISETPTPAKIINENNMRDDINKLDDKQQLLIENYKQSANGMVSWAFFAALNGLPLYIFPEG